MIYNALCLSAHKFTADNGTRPELNCVFFRKNSVVATDGYKLVEIGVPLVKDEDFHSVGGKTAMAGCEPFLLPAGELRSIKLKEKKGELAGVALSHLDNDKAELLVRSADGEGTKVIKREHGKYPDYANLFPTGVPVAEVALNADYLKQVADLCGKLYTANGMTLKFYGGDKPLVIEASNSEQYIKALLMPIKRSAGN